jgi:hypothetical protein
VSRYVAFLRQDLINELQVKDIQVRRLLDANGDMMAEIARLKDELSHLQDKVRVLSEGKQ